MAASDRRTPVHHGRRPGAVLLQLLCVVGLVIQLFGCGSSSDSPKASSGLDAEGAREIGVRPLPLAASLHRADLEISGLAWFGDTLVVLPQYPSRVGGPHTRHLYGLSRSALRRAVADTTGPPLTPFRIPLTAPTIDEHAAAYEGCEAIAFEDDQAYIVVESTAEREGMRSHLFRAQVRPNLERIRLHGESVEALPQQAALPNMSYEALVTRGDTVLTIFEANGAQVNPTPAAYRFTGHLAPIGSLPFPTLEYRLTDATALDQNRRFWVINYFYPDDREFLRPETDSLARRFGTGTTHQGAEVVERLVEYRYTPRGIRRTERPPLWLELTAASPRNWEGIVRFADGFLIATDRFPTTLLAYVPGPS